MLSSLEHITRQNEAATALPMEENSLKKRVILILMTLLLIGAALNAGAEASKEENLSRFLGEWASDEYRLYIRVEGDEVFARLSEVNGDFVWEFNRCYFDLDEGCLYGSNYVRYREFIDWDAMELVQDSWSTGDLAFTCFAFEDDEDVLNIRDVPYINKSLTLRPVDDEA